MTTFTQAKDLDDRDLIDRVREAFDHPLIQTLVDRYEEALEREYLDSIGLYVFTTDSED